MEPHLQPNTHEKFSSYAVTYTFITEQQSPQGDPRTTRHAQSRSTFSQWRERPRSHLALSWQLSKEAKSCDVPVGSACASVLAPSGEAGYPLPPGTSVNKQKRAAPVKPFNRLHLISTAGTAGQTRHSCTALISPFHSGASCRPLRGAWIMLNQNKPCTELWGERTP